VSDVDDANCDAALANPPCVGAATALAATVTVSEEVALAVMFTVTATVAVSPTRAAGRVPTVSELIVAADEGTADNRPKPIAETATSARRLRVVFVDICFLSISRSREFLPFGLKLKFLTSIR
jgi:hypothetical protein